MAGLQKNTPAPEDITVHGASRVLEVSFADGATFRIPFELMRVYSPSAEVPVSYTHLTLPTTSRV